MLFPVLHGPYGEDGSVQGLAKLANIPCVGAGILGVTLTLVPSLPVILYGIYAHTPIDQLFVGGFLLTTSTISAQRSSSN